MRRVVHLTLWDARSVLPLANGPRAQSPDGRHSRTPLYAETCPPWGTDGAVLLVYPIEQWLFEREKARMRWLAARRACDGRWLKPHNLRECFDPTEDPTCVACLALWAAVQVFKDLALVIRAESDQAKAEAEIDEERRTQRTA